MRKKHYLFLSLVLVSGLFLLKTSYAKPAIAVGYYVQEEQVFPLLASSQDGGAKWAYSLNHKSPSLPCDFQNGEFTASSCSGQNCIAVGNYSSNSGGSPLVAHSGDKGLTWQYVIDSTKLPNSIQEANFLASSCSGLHCVAVGSQKRGNNYVPLLANSNDGGASWTYPTDSIKPTLPCDRNGQFSAASCSGSNCIVVGSYDAYPLLANTTDGGETWTYAINSTSPDLPPDFKGGSFSAASCSGSQCIAAGTYGDNESSFGFPLLANSTDGGVSWNYSINRSTPSLPSDFILAVFRSASCSGAHCLAAGFYYSNKGGSFPLMASSKDKGNSWIYTIDSSSTLASDFTSGQFNSVSCSGLHCIASGDYVDTTNSFPLLMNSQDGGMTWSISIDKKTPALPEEFQSGDLFQSNCSGLRCIAAGSYIKGEQYMPLLAHSKDGGMSWNYVIDATKPSLPEGFHSGRFYSAGIASAGKQPKKR